MQRARKGIWRDTFVSPWDWRRGERLAAATSEDHLAFCGDAPDPEDLWIQSQLTTRWRRPISAARRVAGWFPVWRWSWTNTRAIPPMRAVISPLLWMRVLFVSAMRSLSTRSALRSEEARHTVAGVEGKVAFLTGAASGIGRTTAQVLAQGGADVVVTDINQAGAEETAQSVADYG